MSSVVVPSRSEVSPGELHCVSPRNKCEGGVQLVMAALVILDYVPSQLGESFLEQFPFPG